MIEHVRKTISVRNNCLLVCCGLYIVTHLLTFPRLFMLGSNIPNIYCLTLKALSSCEVLKVDDSVTLRNVGDCVPFCTALRPW